MNGLDRRAFLLTMVSGYVTFAANSNGIASELPSLSAYHNPGCTCCHGWAKHMESAGFKVTLTEDPDLTSKQKALGIPEALQGCHFARVGPYILTGHIPSEDVVRFLAEKPNAKGLAVPGMPVGSPGMETGGESEKYSVLIFKADGSSQIYSNH